MKITFKKNEKDVELMAVFLDKMRYLGRKCYITEEEFWWSIDISL